MSDRRIRFAKPEPAQFVSEVKGGVARYFAESGRSPKADGRMVLKTVVLLGGTTAVYLAILSNAFPPWAMLGLAMLMGAGLAGIGFGISHDALHGAYSSSPRVNRLLGYSFDLIGANSYMWKITHNVIHHTYTNIEGVDEDLTSAAPLLRLSPGMPMHWFNRFQHLYGFAAYGFATMNWIFIKDYQQFLKRDLGPYKDRQHPRAEWAKLIGFKLFCYLYLIVVPLVVLHVAWWQYLVGFLVLHVTAGMILGVVFQLAHVGEGPAYPAPDAVGLMENEWIIHEMETTADFAHGNRWLSWYIGGLNYQIEHHLFPHVCSVHYPALREIVRDAAERCGVPYNYHATLFAAIRSHYRMLRRLARVSPPVSQARTAETLA